MTGRLGKRYARALLELARADGAVEAVGQELGRVVAVFEDPRLRPLCLSPALDRHTRVRNIREIVQALRLTEIVGNLVCLLAGRDRLAILPDVARSYEALVDRELGRVRIMIRSATPLTPAERNRLLDLARRLSAARDVVANTEVDPELLGGVVLDLAGKVYDGSLKTRLINLGKEMAQVQGASSEGM